MLIVLLFTVFQVEQRFSELMRLFTEQVEESESSSDEDTDVLSDTEDEWNYFQDLPQKHSLYINIYINLVN